MQDLIDEMGFRRDGRKGEQVRNGVFRLNCFSNADGSAYLEQGKTKVLCAVYGPREPRQRNRQLEDRCFVNCQFSQALFAPASQARRQRGDRKGHEHQRLIEKAMENVITTTSYPHSQIDIFFEVLSSDGSVLSTCFNTAILALADAGIAMKGLPAAVSLGISEYEPCVDLCGREENPQNPVITIAMMGKDVIMIHLQNYVLQDRVAKMLDAGEEACARMSGIMEAAIMKHLKLSFNKMEKRFAAPAVV